MEISKQYLETLKGARTYKENAEKIYEKAIIKAMKNIDDNYCINLIKNNFIAFIYYYTAIKESIDIVIEEYYDSIYNFVNISHINKYFKFINKKELNTLLLDYMKEDIDTEDMFTLDFFKISLINIELYTDDRNWYFEYCVVDKYKFLADKLYNIYLKNKIEIDNYVYEMYELKNLY